MKKDYIEIAGKRYRMESNWNALMAFLDAVGRNTIDELSKIGTLRPSELTNLMVACLTEGERLDGREFTMSALDLGALVTPAKVREFLDIYAAQSAPKMNLEGPKKEERETEPAS